MRGSWIIAGTGATAIIILTTAACDRDLGRDDGSGVAASAGTSTASSAAPSPSVDPASLHEGLLYGRVTTDDDVVYEGRLRWGTDEEALWGNQFNGFKAENPWAAYAPSEQLPRERIGFNLFGLEIPLWHHRVDLGRPFMARFGEIASIEASGRKLWVTLKSGSEFHLDRFASDDLADGLRVWDRTHGVVDIDEWRIEMIELLPAPAAEGGPYPLYGVVRTSQGVFTGILQWDREEALITDLLDGYTADGEVSLPFSVIGSIARQSSNSSLVTLIDGGEIVLSGARNVGEGNRGVYVDDPRYGRVLVSWAAFERVDFSSGGTGPAYGDFPAGRPLSGTVTTRSGRRLTGRLVYDLDESETTETLDAPAQGVDYTIPFGIIASLELPDFEARDAQLAIVTLRSGEELPLELEGDLGEFNAGMLVFGDDAEQAEYVPWRDVERVDFDWISDR